MWLRGSISLILNPFLRVLSISGFLKVIHAPKTPKRGFLQVPQKLTSSIAFFKYLQLGLPMNLINTSMSRVSCQNDENPENQAFFHKMVPRIFIIWTKTIGMGMFRRFMGIPDCKDLKKLCANLLTVYLTFRSGVSLKTIRVQELYIMLAAA